MNELASFDYLILLRLAISVILGGIIGFERGGNHHEAGLRTHIVLCLGAAGVMVLSECMVKQYGIPNEILRMGAQVLSGIGFLGAGGIIVSGNRIRGITTAAGLWTTACIGLAVGAGYYIIASVMTFLLLFAMLALRPITHKITKQPDKIEVELLFYGEVLNSIISELSDRNIEIVSVKHLDETEGATHVSVEFLVPADISISNLAEFFATKKSIKEFKFI